MDLEGDGESVGGPVASSHELQVSGHVVNASCVSTQTRSCSCKRRDSHRQSRTMPWIVTRAFGSSKHRSVHLPQVSLHTCRAISGTHNDPKYSGREASQIQRCDRLRPGTKNVLMGSSSQNQLGDGLGDGTGDGGEEGADDGLDEGIDDGRDDGNDDGTNDGRDEGTNDGRDEGARDGQDEGTDDGRCEGTGDG
mmetsp:Transcript_31709/g.72841  ORF Transcript_31709/g.72841 Transcript_31709/m.72841 type:complete len:194 (+) Transcript_31709:648-1229(+)